MSLFYGSLPPSEPCGAKTLAQQRRHMENEEFAQLARELPLARAISGQHIDKTTMVRLAVAYIKLHRNLCFPRQFVTEFDTFWATHPLDLMDSFLMVLDTHGDVLYVSETISIYLGLSQVEMTGNYIGDYVHPDDWQRFNMVFQSTDGWHESCNIRLKSSLTKRANRDSARASPGFKVLRLEMVAHGGCRLCHCSPLPSLVLSTVSIQNNSFVITVGLDLVICNADERAEQVLGDPYAPPLKGTSFYQLIHVDDTPVIRKMHFEVFSLGAYRTPFYRLILQRGPHSFFAESTVYRYSSLTCKKTTVETITLVTAIL